MYITFEKVRYKNFLSTGNQFTEIHINKSPKTLIHGTNGSGKTTFVDAIYFALYGKSYRKVNKNSVINYITKKNTVVELEFSVNKHKYKIIRGIKPNVFEIYKDDELVNEESTSIAYQKYLEKFILHMNEKLFTQTVLLGSTNYIPFMLLNAKDRRTVIEGLLDIQLFSVMNELAKIKHTDLTRYENNTKYEIEKAIISITHIQEHIKKTQGNTEELVSSIKNKQKLLSEEYESLDAEVIDLLQQVDVLAEERDKIGESSALSELKNKLQLFANQFDTKIKDNLKRVQFYQENDKCPTCSQDITEDLRDEKVNHHEAKVDEHGDNYRKAIDKIKEHTACLSKIEEHNRQIQLLSTSVSQKQSKMKQNLNSIESLNSNIEEISNKSNTTKEEQDLENLLLEKKKLEESLAETELKIFDYRSALVLLKDSGIKSRIVKTYIPVINKLIKKYLDILEFPIIFKFDEEFNEYIKVRGRDEVTYPNLSEGEKMRVNLSLIFAFRELSVLKNATHCNLIIFDEVADSSLDITGWDAFLRILNDVTRNKSQNVFVISHKGESLLAKFNNDIRFEKRGGRFSEIVKK